MSDYNLLDISKSTKSDKKMMAIFINKNTNRIKTVHFGDNGMSDFTIHKDIERKKRYLNRHMKNENWENPITAGALSRWILWNKKSLILSVRYYKKKFNFK